MSRLIHLPLVACMVFATLLEETVAFAVERASLGDDHDHVHRESVEIFAVYDDDRMIGDLDHEDSLEVYDVRVSEQVYGTSQENHSVKGNSFRASGQKGILFHQVQHQFESIEDDDEKPFQHQRSLTNNSRGSHQLWDISDEQQSWETTDRLLEQLFRIRWDSAENKKFTRLSTVDDSMEDLLHEQHQAQSEHVRSKRPSVTAI